MNSKRSFHRAAEPRPELVEGAHAANEQVGQWPFRLTLLWVLQCLTLAGVLAGCAHTYQSAISRHSDGFAPVKSRVNGSPPGSEELWLIARGPEASEASEELPGTATLLAKDEDQEIPMPLKHTDVRASISGYIGGVEVRQQFLNPYDRKIEAVYVFPLPHNAAVNEFILTIGKRRIRGIIRERQEAEQLYQQARQQGYVATLLTQERPNVFSESVGNLEPGKEAEVAIKYFSTLDYADGWYEFVFPLVVGPRFSPRGARAGVGAVMRRQAGASGQDTESQYLRPGERTGHDVSLKLEVDAGVPIEEFECKTHRVTTESLGPGRLVVSLDPGDSLPNRDFVWRYRVAGGRVKTGWLTHRDERGSFFTLMIFPPEELGVLARQPLEVVFVLDCSGSMAGRPIAQAKAAVERGLRLLQPDDSFQLVTLSMSASKFDASPLAATPENVQHVLEYLQSLNGEGGTMMLEGVKAALDLPDHPQRLRFVCFLTDGYIGNEAEVLGAVRERLGAARIFSFGIGAAVNRHLLEAMARSGRGAVAYLGLNDNAATIMENCFTRISHPALTDLQIDWGGLHVADVLPRTLPDLFAGRPVIVTGRFAGNQEATIRINGMAAGQPMQVTSTLAAGDAAKHAALPSIWARMKLADLADQSSYEPAAAEQMKQLALDYSLVSPFTGVMAVDSSFRTTGSPGVTVPVAVPVPAGTDARKAVGE